MTIRVGLVLKELLGHVRTATFVHDVGDSQKDLEGNHQEDEKAHTRGGCGDGCQMYQ